MKTNKVILFLLAFFLLNGCYAQHEKSIEKALVEQFYDDIDLAVANYKKLKNDYPQRYNFGEENELNNLGYRLLNDYRVEDAIKIFKLLVAEFPNSANAYDSLGEAYLKNNNQDLALKNYKKSLALNPANENADRAIIGIEFANRNQNKFNKIYSAQAYLDDLEQLANTLTTVNPHPYKFMSKDDFWQIVEQKKKLITAETTYSEFIWHCSEIVANINCGHSSLFYFNQEKEMLPTELFFPIVARFIDDKLFVTDPLENTNIQQASEILTINGYTVEELRRDIFKHISSQGHIETSKYILLNGYMRSYIPYALNFPDRYTITVKGLKNPIELKQLSTYQAKPRHFPTNLCESKDLCLDFVEDSVAVLTIINTGAYYGNRFSVYKAFIDKSFQEIKASNIKELIIDMRSNGGGPGNTGVYLLRYLAEKAFVFKKLSEGSNMAHQSYEPFENAFRGNTYFLIDGGGSSTTGHVLSLVKELKLATIIGEELGSNHFCTGGQRQFKLTNTDLFYYVGRFTNITTADTFPDNRGIMPDHFVKQNIQDYLNDVDTVLAYTLKLIREK